MRLISTGLLFGALSLASLSAQSVLSVHSGVVHYTEGDAFIGDQPVEMKFGHFPEIKENEVFRTEEGLAEVLLTPGSFLRVSQNTSVRMISNRLSDTRFELLKGEILVEQVDGNKDTAAAMAKGNMISVVVQGTTTSLLKPGLYQFNAEPSRLRVYEGEAAVKMGGDQLTLGRAKETQLQGTLMAVKFDPKVGDELVRWSSRRSGYLAMANVNAARTLSQDTTQWNSYLGSGSGWGGWAFNPLFGMYTYVPYGGIGYSPFGYNYWSPYSVYYAPYGMGYYGGGYYPGYYGTNSYGGGSSSASASNRSPIVNRAPGRLGNGGRGGGGFGSSAGFGPAARGSASSSTSSVSAAARSSAPAASSGGFGGGAHSSGGHR